MVPESNRKAGPFTGTGQTQFDFDFYMLSADDVVVIVADADENETTLSKDAYTCTLNSDQNTTPGGRVTLKTALATGHKLAICSGVPYTQNLNLTMYGNFNPTSINKEEDRRVIQLQQIVEQMRRCLVVPITNDKTPQQVLKEVLEIAATANEYAQLAQQIYATVEDDVAEIKALKVEIDELVKTFSNIKALAQSVQVAAASAEQDAADAQKILQKVREAAERAGFSMRSHSYLTANATVSLTSILPSVNVKAGDLILSRSDGNVFSVMSVTSTTATVGTVIANLRGPRGLQGNDGAKGGQGAPGLQGSAGATFTPAVSTEGVLSWTNDRGLPNPTPVNIKGAKGDKGEPGEQGSPGPVGSTGPQGPMGSSPWAAAFGQFRIKDSYLKMDYVGVQPATNFTINSNGELEATV